MICVCSKHFVSGRPLKDTAHPDFVLSKKLGYKSKTPGLDLADRRQKFHEESTKKICDCTVFLVLVILENDYCREVFGQN